MTETKEIARLPMPEYVVLAGGGTRGYAYLGALLVLHDTMVREGVSSGLQSLRGAAGTSVGSAYALMLCCGLEPLIGMLRVVRKIDPQRVIKTLSLSNVEETRAVFAIDMFREHLNDILDVAGIPRTVTYRQLFEHTGRWLSVNVTNLTRNAMEVHDHAKTPDMSVVASVLTSMAIPCMFPPQNLPGSDAIYCDGGIIQNLMFPHPDFPVEKTLAFQFPTFIDFQAPATQGPKRPFATMAAGFIDFLKYGFQVMSLAASAQSIMQVSAFTPEERKRLVTIESGATLGIDFRITHKKRLEMVKSGCASMRAYIQDHMKIEKPLPGVSMYEVISVFAFSVLDACMREPWGIDALKAMMTAIKNSK